MATVITSEQAVAVPHLQRPSIPSKPLIMPNSTTSPSAPSPSAQPSLMTKEWVIPPRPKPGRKPATDTPPTKRKAQNRAAQRAFRERRAARVGELEEQMKQMEDEDEREQNALRSQIEQLQNEVEQHRRTLDTWIEKCRGLEQELANVRAGHAASSTSTEAVPLRRRNRDNPVASPPRVTDMPMGCGNCTLETSCQCLDEIVAANDESMPFEKRPHSPTITNSDKRVKTESTEELEIDFTSVYSTRPPVQTVPRPPPRSSAVQDPCGFCQDGTHCICAEVAAEVAAEEELQALQATPTTTNTVRPSISHLSQFTPPPSEGDFIAGQTNVPNNPCASGPGTCAQCRADPNSTLFCKSLAASRSQIAAKGAPIGGCCGGSQVPGSSCCLSTPRATRSRASAAAAAGSNASASSSIKLPSIRLSCADAFQTLSRHPGYGRASSDIGSWMPTLVVAKDVDAAVATQKMIEGRPALEIDAASIMTVLKDFDRRFS